jgi:hypothetical protein
VLAAAVLLVAWPLALRLAALVIVVVDAVARRPPAAPASLIVGSDATCLVPEWSSSRMPLGRRTVVCAYWIRLDVGSGSARRDILLFIDQLGLEQWALLRALLERARCDGAHVLRPPREPI